MGGARARTSIAGRTLESTLPSRARREPTVVLFSALRIMDWALTMAMPHAEPTAIDDLTRFYIFKDEALVREFLSTRPNLVALLEEAVPHVYEAFGSDTPITLDVDWDDEEGEPPELIAWIRTNQGGDEARAALHRFDWSWWLFVNDPSRLDLVFMIRRVRPPAHV